jgi:predicted transcriptional regulator
MSAELPRQSNSYRDPRELRAEAGRLMATAHAIEDGTWAFVCETDGPCTTTALALHLGLSPQAANNRLRKLYDLRLLDRSPMTLADGGREFVYELRLRDA